MQRTPKVSHGLTNNQKAKIMSKTIEEPAAEAVELHRLVGQLKRVEWQIMEEMRRAYPDGSRVAFWRSSSQRNESFGEVVGYSMSHGPAIQVRYDNSKHVVRLGIGYAKIHSLPNK